MKRNILSLFIIFAGFLLFPSCKNPGETKDSSGGLKNGIAVVEENGIAVVEEKVEISLKDGKLTLLIPIQRSTDIIKEGRLIISVLDPQDKALARESRDLILRGSYFIQKIDFKDLPKEFDPDIARVRYILQSESEKAKGIFALSNYLGKLELTLLGQTEFLSGSKGSLRIIAWDRSTGEPVSGASVKIIMSSETPKVLYSGRTNSKGTLDVSFNIPDEKEGSHKLTIEVKSSVGEQKFEREITLKKQNKILLTTDKPIYQPGQTMHIRALTMKEPSRVPLSGSSLTFEVSDGKGNKVYKKKFNTNRFGIASCDFTIADEVNAGRYTIKAIVGNNTQEKTVTVKPYVLPKFKIVFKTDKEYYLPGETVKGEVQCNYFFGKPVVGGKVDLTLNAFDIGMNQIQTIHAITDKEGHADFEIELPKYFVGIPLEQGSALIKFDVSVKDKADHQEQVSDTRTVAKDPIKVSIIPEGKTLSPGLENTIYVVTTYPDGNPAKTSVTLKQQNSKTYQKQDSDKLGISKFTINNVKKEGITLEAEASDSKGNSGKTSLYISPTYGEEFVILRLERAIYKVGESAKLSIYATKKKGIAYVDVIHNRQTLLTKSVEIKNGVGTLNLDLNTDLEGSLWLHSYIVEGGADIARDTKVIYVNPASDLKIAIKPNKNTYLPADEAIIDFQVTDTKGHPVFSALGIQIVDEAVFALSENQPGMEKVYFMLEQELLEPKFEVHGFGPIDIVSFEKEEAKDRAAQILFSKATKMVSYALMVDTYNEERQKISNSFSTKIYNDWYKIQQGLIKYQQKTKKIPKETEALSLLLRKSYIKEGEAQDPWGNQYIIENLYNQWSFTLRSFGPDEKKGTTDDLNYGGWWWCFAEDEMAGERIVKRRMMARNRGGGGGMFLDGPPLPASMAVPEKDFRAKEALKSEAKADASEPRVREYFPETLFSEPSLITDMNGRAQIKLRVADSITKWRLLAMASSLNSELGSTTSNITVFQDFFCDLDLPVSLTQGDIISIPVALYNYLSVPQKVRLEIMKDNWFTLKDEPTKEKVLQKEEVSVLYFTISAKELGKHRLTVKAYGSKMSDAISREIEVVPDGEEQLVSYSDRLKGNVDRTVIIPKEAIDGASKIMLRVYPGIFSQVVSGLESMLHMPSGCFEQASSMTYPDILVLNYLRKTNQTKPEIEMKAEEYIALGYQRLLSYEISGGGFEWFGNAPANQILTAYGLMEFYDMSKVHEIDENVITRTQNWLVSKQGKDGSWSPDKSYLHTESWGKIQNSKILPTAYITWALKETGYKGESVKRGIEYINAHIKEVSDPYTLALIANAFVSFDPENDATRDILGKLLEKAKIENDAMFWKSEIPTVTFSKDESADIEATALAGYALIRSGTNPDAATKVLTYLVRHKDAYGSWYSTQGTIMSLRTMVAALEKTTEKTDATVAISINGKEVNRFKLTKENADLMQQFDLKEYTKAGENTISLSLVGKGTCLYEIVSKYYLPWELAPKPEKPALSIRVDYDKTELTTNDLVTCTVKAKNNVPAVANMVILDVGIPPGFDVQTPDLDEIVGKKIQKYSVTPRQVILYLEKIESGKPFEISFGMKARFPIKAKTRLSKAYEYYNPDSKGVTSPILVTVTK